MSPQTAPTGGKGMLNQCDTKGVTVSPDDFSLNTAKRRAMVKNLRSILHADEREAAEIESLKRTVCMMLARQDILQLKQSLESHQTNRDQR